MASNQFTPNDSYDLTANIANGATASDVIDLSGTDVCGLFFPAAMTGTSVTIQAASTPSGTYGTVQKDEAGGGDYAITVSAGKYVPITNLAVVAGLRFIKLVSNATEGSARSIVLATRPV